MITLLYLLIIGLFGETDQVKIVLEAEQTQLNAGWELETSYDDYTGSGYITWKSDSISFQPQEGVLAYTFKVAESGFYQLKLRNRYECEDLTECNDVWTRMDDGQWIKAYSHTNYRWNLQTGHDINHELNEAPGYQLSNGKHTFYLAGRSPGFSIDQIVFEKISLSKM
ncbi:carbohydrate-binding protein [Marinoscillum furvescens]|uniref:Uncharacterized protein n=1 Tax=Marinoscillum furvescens DSM 4134 TaxID=1122208 RepID=A0A3D9KZF4_MARFU|nr:hypothetical protein [Marinoscillum furvescens]RED95670.1 hypothetical protein C7460_117120 [Marinoscillum furvescens DSM 4134]